MPYPILLDGGSSKDNHVSPTLMTTGLSPAHGVTNTSSSWEASITQIPAKDTALASFLGMCLIWEREVHMESDDVG